MEFRKCPSGYYSKSSNGAILIRNNTGPTVMITHPFDQSVNVAAGVSFDFFTIFQSFCAESKDEVMYILEKGLKAERQDNRTVSNSKFYKAKNNYSGESK